MPTPNIYTLNFLYLFFKTKMQIHMQRFNASSSDTSNAQGKYLKKYYVCWKMTLKAYPEHLKVTLRDPN